MAGQVESIRFRYDGNQGVLTLAESIGNQREVNEAKKHHVELFRTGEDAAEAFEWAK